MGWRKSVTVKSEKLHKLINIKQIFSIIFVFRIIIISNKKHKNIMKKTYKRWIFL